MLDVLVFTDSLAEESLSGAPGWQFIARSSGANPTDEVIAKQQQHSLQLALREDDWVGHPETCGYVRSGQRMYLSRGHSTGRTLGGRFGNQLTVTLMTSEPYDILPLRPAQLYSSPAWDLSRPTTQNVAPWDVPVEIAEDFDIPGLQALVVDDSWASSVLSSVLTMLDQTQAERRKRLLIRHADQRVIMRWVALLSHFLDAERALGFEFRVFAEAPLSSNQHVVGVHPAISPNLNVAMAQQEGVNLLDLERHELSSVTPTESAIRYARLFSSGDPYEALEAIEVGRRWSRHMAPDIAAVAAELATMGAGSSGGERDVLTTAVIALRNLADAGQADELDSYGDALVDLVASCRPTDAADLLLIDSALWSVSAMGDIELAQSIAVAALEWAAAQPSMLAAWCTSARPRTRLMWQDEEKREYAAGRLATGLEGIGDSMLPDAFALAKTLNTGVTAAALAAPIRRLADVWSVTPALTSTGSAWVQYDTVAARLEHVLDERLAAADSGVIASLHRGDWDWLSPVPWTLSPARPMSKWAAVRELRGARPERRAEVLADAGPSLPSSAWWVLLTQQGALDPTEVAEWIQTHDDLDPALAREIDRVLDNLKQFPSWRRANGGALVMHRIGNLPGAVPLSFQGLVTNQAEIFQLFARAKQTRDRSPNPELRRLRQRYPGVLNGLYGEWIATEVLEARDTVSAIALADGSGQSAVIAYTREKLEAALRAPTPTAMRSAVRLLDPSLGRWSAAANEALLAVWDDRNMQAICDWLLKSVDGRLDPRQQDFLDHFLTTHSKGRFTRGVARGAKAVFTGREKKN